LAACIIQIPFSTVVAIGIILSLLIHPCHKNWRSDVNRLVHYNHDIDMPRYIVYQSVKDSKAKQTWWYHSKPSSTNHLVKT